MADETFHIPEQSTESPEQVTFMAAPEAADPEAPYGRFDNGKPRKTPPKTTKAPKTAAAPKASAPKAPRKGAAADFRPAIQEGISLLSVPLMGLGRLNRAFLADAATLQMNSKPLAHALNECAKINPTIERLLSTSAPAVPYVLLGSALFNMGVQMMANHGKAVPVPGVKIDDPEELAAAMEQQMRVAAEQAAPEQHQYAAAAA
ncbi:hypothetical protein JGS39_24140 [Streptomyces sp. P01-B04]|uniref:hypothetical protein n=1 Tax=Streptomyces poriferorum TaxID=2798799 RepID=UPI001C604D26|nr:hypothetical protein [Streptomyces poriferorum]MBW5252053.1 hypothetical protein [Streptomyces poriferorum]MBW5260223.1 hypothetical protein [Streptomyces poriferorum]